MLIEGQFSIEEKPQVAGGGLSGHRNSIEGERRVYRLVVFRGELNLNRLFGYVWVKYHFPLIGPLSNFIQVFREEAVGSIHVSNANEERGVIGEEFNLRRNIISEVVYIDEEEEGAKH